MNQKSVLFTISFLRVFSGTCRQRIKKIGKRVDVKIVDMDVGKALGPGHIESCMDEPFMVYDEVDETELYVRIILREKARQ